MAERRSRSDWVRKPRLERTEPDRRYSQLLFRGRASPSREGAPGARATASPAGAQFVARVSSLIDDLIRRRQDSALGASGGLYDPDLWTTSARQWSQPVLPLSQLWIELGAEGMARAASALESQAGLRSTHSEGDPLGRVFAELATLGEALSSSQLEREPGGAAHTDPVDTEARGHIADDPARTHEAMEPEAFAFEARPGERIEHPLPPGSIHAQQIILRAAEPGAAAISPATVDVRAGDEVLVLAVAVPRDAVAGTEYWGLVVRGGTPPSQIPMQVLVVPAVAADPQ